MKLAIRLVSVLVLSLAALVTVDGYLEHERERQLIGEGVSRDVVVLGHAMSSMVEEVWHANGGARALELVAGVNSGESDILIRWVWLDAQPGEALAPTVSSREAVSASLRTGAFIESAAVVENRWCAYFPVDVTAGRPGALELSQSADEASSRATRPLRRLVAQLIALFLIGAVATYFIGVRIIGRPLQHLTAKIERVAEGDLSGPLELRGSHELTDLAAGVNSMCERLSASQARVAEETAAKIAAIEQARHADRLRTVGQMASGVAHELGTPLNVVSGRAALIEEEKLDSEQVRQSAKIIGAQADRMSEIIRQLLTFARSDPATTERVDVASAARQAIVMVQSAAKTAGVTLSMSSSASGATIAEGNASALLQVITNLVINAIQASARGGAVSVAIGAELASEPDRAGGEPRPCVRVEVRDNGSGIPNDVLPRVFEPFFTTKEVGSGTGLGLSIVHGILRDHDGWITVVSEPGEGSCFIFYLPASTA